MKPACPMSMACRSLVRCWIALTLLAGSAWAQGLTAVVVWDFENLSPAATAGPNPQQLDYLKRALSENLTVALLGSPGLQVVERQRLKQLLAEQKLSAADLTDQDTRLKLGRIIGAGRMVFGSFFALGDQVQVNLRVVETATSRVVFSDELASEADAVMQRIDGLNRRLVRKLGDGSASTHSYPAALWQTYDQALALSDAGRDEQAIESLQRLLAQHKDFVPAERQLVALLEKLNRR